MTVPSELPIPSSRQTDSPLASPPWPAHIVTITKWALLPMGLYCVLLLVGYMNLFHGLISIQEYHVPVNGSIQIRHGIVGDDFVTYWTAARAIFEGRLLTLFDYSAFTAFQNQIFGVTLSGIYNWSYPPHFLLYILWLGFFPYPVALVLWMILTFILYVWVVAVRRPMQWGIGLLLCVAPTTYLNAGNGQNGFLSAAFMIGGLRLLSSKPILAGILFGLLSFKPQLGILMPVLLLVTKQWRALGAAAVTTLVLVGLSIAVFGFESWKLYVENCVPFQAHIMELNTIKTSVKMSPTVFMALRFLGSTMTQAFAVSIAMGLAMVAVLVYALPKCRSDDLRLAIFVTATFLASPYLFEYDMTSYTAALIALVAAVGPRLNIYHLCLIGLCWILPILLWPLNRSEIEVAPIIILALLLVELHFLKDGKTAKSPLLPAQC